MARTRHQRNSSTNTSAVSSALSSRMPSRAPSPSPAKRSFRFFDLPAELRLRIYEEVLHVADPPLDLHEMNFRRVHPRMSLFLVSKQMHEEAYRVFYAQPIRLFPRSGRFFHTKKPLLQRLPFKYREAVNTLELRLGPGFTAPPRCQNTLPSLGLADCLNMRTLKVFVECDPSDPVFAGFRGANSTEETYKWFCVDLLVGILQQVPSLETIEIDAYPSVKKNAPLVSALVNTAQDAKKKLAWGPQRCWEEDDKPMIIGLKGAMASMTISNNEIPRAVAVRA